MNLIERESWVYRDVVSYLPEKTTGQGFKPRESLYWPAGDDTVYLSTLPSLSQGELLAKKKKTTPMLAHLSYQEELARSGTTEAKKQGYYTKGHSQNSGL